jgi:uncharacterized protein (TIGR02421 family)
MLGPEVLDVDRALAGLAARVDLLLDVTPVNADEAWDASLAAGHREELALRYRAGGTDVEAVARDLRAVPLDRVTDPALHDLLAGKAAELDLQLRLVAARDTPAFLDRSLDLWGTADDALLDLAEVVLHRLPAGDGPTALVTPADFARRAAEEIERYRRQDPDLRAEVTVRSDVPSLMVVQRDLFVGTDSWIPAHREEALVHHEVGVHLLTAATGARQPLRLLEHGLAGFEETQEALGVLAEHLVDGLDAHRVRTLAARALAARRLSDGAGFPELFAELHEEHRFDERAAWTIAMRVVRGGGLTKDVIYLRGIVAVVEHLAAGEPIEPLLAGKLHLHHVPAIAGLLERGVLHRPHLRPHWLDGPVAEARLAALRAGSSPVASWP